MKRPTKAFALRSAAEMISKISVVEQEADESAFWMELVVDHGLMPAKKVTPRHSEADEITAMMVASRNTLLARNRESRI